MARIRIKRLAAAVLAIAAGGATVASAATSSSPFRIVPSPSPGSPRLLASAAISPTDVWAVGSDDNTREGFAEHWNGHTWTVVATPSRIQGGGGLVSVSAVSSTDVWAVGASGIEHWNGKAWSVVPEPAGGGFLSVHAISANNVYAVGAAVEHWNGSKWSTIQTALPGTGSNTAEPKSVSASSASDVWIAGELPPQVTNQPYIGFAEHFDGKVWRNVPFPGGPTLSAVLAVSPTNAWAVGDTISHWNGRTWTRVPNILTFNSGLHLNAITEVSPTDLWAVGYNDNGAGNSNFPFTFQTFAEHFNGTSWSVVPASNPANPSGTGTILWGLSSTAGGHVYAVGQASPDPYTAKTLILENDLG